MGQAEQQSSPAGQRCLILFGAPGSGKGTQAKLLKNSLGWAHISTGDMLREHVAKQTEIGLKISELMKTGSLIPDEIVNSLVDERIHREDCREGFILDGYPRTVPQADLLVRTLRTNGIKPVVVHLKVDYNIIVARLASRRLCSHCGQLYSVASNAPIVTEGCDYCGGKLVTREDDKPEVIWKRLETYDNQTFPVLYFLLGAGYAEHDFDGSDGSPQQIAARISDAVLGEGEFVIVRRSQSELEKMRTSGLLVHDILQKLGSMVHEGITTNELEVEAAKMMADAGAKPAFKGYKPQSAAVPYPYILCTSINDEIVHGMPSKTRKLNKGDIVSIDTGLCLNGYYGDSAITVGVGEIPERVKKLLQVTKESLELAIEQMKPGNRLFDVSGAVEKHVVANGFSVVREMVGHGIGTKLHEEPQVPNFVDRRHENPRLKEGMVLAIEPMVNLGRPDMKIKSDKWTAVTKDGSPSAHFEHVVAVTAGGPWVLTRP